MIGNVKHYLSLVKFSHTVFALPFAIIGYFLGLKHTNASFNYWLLLEVIGCMVFARNAAMAFNRLVDRHYDSLNPRTTQREIPAKTIKLSHARVFITINCLLFIATTYFINNLVFLLSPVALLVILGYSYAKRFTYLCHLILGLGLSLAPIGAYLTVTGKFHWLPIMFSIVVMFWTAGFDIIYALQDIQFDQQQKLKSIPAFLGNAKALIVARIFHGISSVTLISIMASTPLGFLFYVGGFVFISGLIYQHSIIKATDLSKINMSFFVTNGVISILMGALTVSSILLQVRAE